MLFHPVGLSDPIRVQGAFVTDAEVEAVMEALKKQNKGNSYDEQAIEDINRAAKKCSKKKDSDFDEDDGDDESAGEGYLNDQKFLDAVDVAIKNQKIATSLIQRKLSIGYGKAAKYIDVMESLGIVGEANGPKPREVLITMDEWHEMLARRDLD
jgi:S-DNA-T family DNA segregation ATPase FtsK/SpoIIIE